MEKLRREILVRKKLVFGVGEWSCGRVLLFGLRSLVSLWGLPEERARGRAVDRGVEDVPRASQERTEGEPADLQGSRDFFISFLFGICSFLLCVV